MSSTPPLFSVSPSEPFPTFTRHRPTQTFGVDDSDNGPRQQGSANPLASAALYLYTFLATLVLLVGISLFIVVRSVVQRQRRNRALQAALSRYRDGSTREGDLELVRLVELRMNHTVRGLRVDMSKMPKMWEVQLAPTSKLIVSEKTAEGKVISSSWKSHHQSSDPKSSLYPAWSWSSILPLSSTLLSSDRGTTDAGSAMVDGRSVPLRRFFGRMLHGSGSASGHRNGHVVQGAHDQSRPNAPASSPPLAAALDTTSNNTNANSIDSVDGMRPFPPSDNHPSMDTHTEADRHPEEGAHMHGSSGSSSSSSSGPHPPNSNANMDQTLPNINTSTSTTERADSGSTHPLDQRRGQVDDGETHISPRIPPDLHQNKNQTQTPDQNQHHTKSSGTRIGVDGNATRLRVAVLVRMPTPPSHSASSPSRLLSGLSKAKSKAKAESGLGEKRLSAASSLVSTLGGGKQKDAAEVPALEVGLVDVDVSSDFCGVSEGGTR